MNEYKERVEGITWDVHISYPFPAAVLIQCTGYLDISSVVPVRVPMQRVIDSGRKVHTFFNLCEVSGYDSHVRSSQAQWLRARMHQIESFHILMDSPLTSWGVSYVSRLLNDGIQMYHDEHRFLDVLNRATEDAWTACGVAASNFARPYIFDCSKRITRS